MNRLLLHRRSLLLGLLTGAVLLSATSACKEQAPPAAQARKDAQDHAHGDDGHAADASASAIMAAHRHDSPGETCFMCDPAKRDQGRLWCKEHARYEDRCWICHPELEDKSRRYCREHFLYEDECLLCRPEVKGNVPAANPSPPSRGNADHDHPHDPDTQKQVGVDKPHAGGQALYCHEHDVAEAECAICQPDLAKSLKPGEMLKIRLPSTTSAQNAGIQTSRPEQGRSSPSVEALCEVQYNLNTMARVTPLADGIIRHVAHDVGDQVAAGDVLVELHSAPIAAAKSDYLTALVERDVRQQGHDRQKHLRQQQLAAEKEHLEAQAALRSANLTVNHLRQRLLNLGLLDAEISRIEQDQDTSARLVIRAPFSGTVVERRAVAGEAVNVGDPLFTVADLSSRWLILSIPSRHTHEVRSGQHVKARFDEIPGSAVNATITWIDTAVDPRSRMIKARALVTADAERIKTGLFGKASILLADERPATLVPRQSVQRHEGGTFVFVQNEPDLFSIRRVTLGQTDGPRVEVLAGLTPADAVVTDGSFIVLSEFLKSRLGAGCADH